MYPTATGDKKEQFQAIYLNMQPRIRAHCTHVGIVTGCFLANRYRRQLCKTYGVPEAALAEVIMKAGEYHDIGKSMMSDALCKKTRLNQTERKMLRQHPQLGVQLLDEFGDALFDSGGAKQVALDMALCHHEHFDGSGYPNGLKADEIPLLAQLCALANELDNAVHTGHRNAFGSVADLVMEKSGVWFSKAAVSAFTENMDEITALYTQKHSWIKAGAADAAEHND